MWAVGYIDIVSNKTVQHQKNLQWPVRKQQWSNCGIFAYEECGKQQQNIQPG
jgi:hypothetical protein